MVHVATHASTQPGVFVGKNGQAHVTLDMARHIVRCPLAIPKTLI